jgi:Domain of unknown function (DUF5979)
LPAGVTTNTCTTRTVVASQVVGVPGQLTCAITFPAPLNGSVVVTGGSAATNDTNGGNDPSAVGSNNPSSATLGVAGVNVSGRVYRESLTGNTADNGNATDPGLVTTVSISCTNPAYTPVLPETSSKQTNADGTYSFTGVPAGASCTITETQPAGYSNAYTQTGTTGNPGALGAVSTAGAGSTTNSTISLTVPPGGSTQNNFAEQGADMQPSFSGMPSVMAPGGVYNNLTLTCTNNGPGAAVAPTCAPSVDIGTVSNIVCTPNPLPATLSQTAPNNTLVCTFTYTAPTTGNAGSAGAGGGNLTPVQAVFTGTTTASNDSVGGTNTSVCTSQGAGTAAAVNTTNNNCRTWTAPFIDTLDDSPSTQQYSSTGSTNYPLLTNDAIGITTNPAVGTNAGQVAVTITNNGGLTGATVSATGELVVPNNTAPGVYTVTYQACTASGLSAPNPTQACDTATKQITVQASDMTSKVVCSPLSGKPGDTISCTVTCTNGGPDAAVNASCNVTNSSSLPGYVAGSCPLTGQSVTVGASISCGFTFRLPSDRTNVSITAGTGADNDIRGGTDQNAVNNNISNTFVNVELAVPTLSALLQALLVLLMAAVGYARNTRNTRNTRGA